MYLTQKQKKIIARALAQAIEAISDGLMDTDVQHLLTHGYIIRYYDKIGYSHNTSLYLTHKAKEILEKNMFVKQSFLYYKRENLLFAELNETQKDIIAKTLAWDRVLRL